MKNLNFKMTSRRTTVFLLMCLTFLFVDIGMIQAQTTLSVTGTVTDKSNGEPLIGASVLEKGTTNGVITDIEGNYSFKVKSGATIVISSIGYKSMEITAKSGAKATVQLEEDSEILDEVVVVGYGVQKKVNLTGAVSTVSDAKLENRAAPNLSTMLTGLASGVSVRQSSGNPGEDGASIRIRGVGTFSGDYRSPLVVIDGAVADMNSVNPEDVESISVLKDAASAAIYGARGANGVILVTTKKGTKNAAPHVNYTGVFSRATASRVFGIVSDYADYMELYNMAEFSNNPKVSSTYDPEEIAAWREGKMNPNGTYIDPDNGNQVPNYIAYPNTDWSKILFAPNYSQKHNLSISGGSGNSNYLLSLGYYDNPGTLENTGVNRYNFRVNVESRISKYIKVGTQTYAMRQQKDPGNLDMVNTYRFQTVAGIVPYYNGKYGAPESPREKNDVRNPLKDVNAVGGVNTTTRINTTWYTDLNLYKGLTARGSVNYQNYSYESKTYTNHLDGYTFRKGTILQPGSTLAAATTKREADRNEQTTLNFTVNYNTTVAKDHDISAMAGYEQIYYNTSGFDATKIGLLAFDITDITTGSEMKEISGDVEKDYALVSFFARLNYAYMGRYLLEANVRRDGSSRFSPDNRWGTFPSISLGWRISEEEFFEPLKDKVNNLKLRASWGKLGNTTSGYYDWQATYTKAKYAFNNVISDGMAVSKLANSLLQWESVTSSGIGLDASLLDSRLTAEVDYYNRLTKGILTTPSIYLTMGTATAPTKNTSDMRNSGLEVSLGWNDKIGDARYSVNGNFSYNINEVVKYKGKLQEGWKGETYTSNIGDVADVANDQARLEGHLFDEYYLRTRYHGSGAYTNTDGSVNPNGGPKDGMIRSEADLNWVRSMISAGYSFNGKSVNQNEGLWYGEYLYADLNGDKNYGNSYDRYFTGKSTSPKYNFGLSLSAEYKGFDFSMTLAGAAGFWYYLRERGASKNNLASKTDVLPSDTRSKFYYLAYDKATGEPLWNDPSNNLTAEYARLRTGGDGPYASNDQFLYDASYLKLKTVQIGYTFPKTWTRKVQMENLRLFLTGENLLTITGYPGVDPEIGSGLNVYPISRLLSVGVNISF